MISIKIFSHRFGSPKSKWPDSRFSCHSCTCQKEYPWLQHVTSTQESLLQPLKSFSSTQIRECQKNPSLPNVTSTRHLDPSPRHVTLTRHFDTSLRQVTSTRIFKGFLVWKWRVKLTFGSAGFVLKWREEVPDLCWSDVWKWRIFGAEKEWPLCRVDVLKWRVCGIEGYSARNFVK